MAKLYSITGLTRDELTVITYLVQISDPEYGDPLRNIYELGDNEPADPYGTLRSLRRKVRDIVDNLMKPDKV